MLAHFGHHLLTALPIPLLPLIRDDFALNYTQAGLVVSAFSLSYGFSQLPAGWLADRIGHRVLITIGTCGVAVAGLLVGLSHTYIMMIIFLVLMGVAGGGYHPSAAPLIGASVEPEKRGRALGFHLVGGSGSFFLAPLIAAVIAATWGWRGAFVGLAIPTALFGIAFYMLLGRVGPIGKNMQIVTDQYDETPPPPKRLRRLVVFLVLTTSIQAITMATIAFIPLFMVDNFGISEAKAAAFLSIIYSAGLWAAPLGGYISDRVGRVQVILASCLISGPLLYLLNVTTYGIAFGILLLSIGMFMIVRGPTAEAYLVSEVPANLRSTIFGVYYFAGMEGGAVLTPVMGSLVDQIGFNSSFTIASIAVVLITLTCSVFLRRSRY